MALKGLANVLKNLNGQIKGIRGRTQAGLRAGGLIVERESKKRVPIEYGNLRSSGYSRNHMSKPLAVEVGFAAVYALWVHENYEMKWAGKPRKSGIGEYWGPHGEAGFLVNSLRDKAQDVVEEIRKRARVK